MTEGSSRSAVPECASCGKLRGKGLVLFGSPSRRINEVCCGSAEPLDDSHGQLHVGRKAGRAQSGELMRSAAEQISELAPGQALLATFLVHDRPQQFEAPAKPPVGAGPRQGEARIVTAGHPGQEALRGPIQPPQHEQGVLAAGLRLSGQLRQCRGADGMIVSLIVELKGKAAKADRPPASKTCPARFGAHRVLSTTSIPQSAESFHRSRPHRGF